MIEKSRDISIGIGGKKVPVGTHVCLVYSSQMERINSFMQFVLSGLQAKERLACFTERITEKDVREYLYTHGISYDESKSADAVILEGTRDTYFENGTFNPDRMLKTMDHYYHESIDMGFPAARVIGDMVSEIVHMPGGDRLLNMNHG
jgi:hypothetical protein